MKNKIRGKPDKTFRNLLILTGLVTVGALIYWISLSPPEPSAESAGSSAQQTAAASESQRGVPPFFASARAAKPYPKLIPAVYYRQYPLVERAYKDAAAIPGVVAQQPCYCYCDRVGHRSLLDCYSSDHAAG